VGTSIKVSASFSVISSVRRHNTARRCRAARARASVRRGGISRARQIRGEHQECEAVKLRLYAYANMPGAAVAHSYHGRVGCECVHAVAGCDRWTLRRVT